MLQLKWVSCFSSYRFYMTSVMKRCESMQTPCLAVLKGNLCIAGNLDLFRDSVYALTYIDHQIVPDRIKKIQK